MFTVSVILFEMDDCVVSVEFSILVQLSGTVALMFFFKSGKDFFLKKILNEH